MMARYRARRLAGMTVLALALLAGCRHASPKGANPVAWDTSPTASLGDSQVADVQVALARTLESRGAVAQALPVYQEAVKKDPRRADAWARLAILSDKEGRFAESAEYYKRALELQPDNPDVLCNLGYSLYLQQRWAEAEETLRRAAALRPDHPKTLNNLGLVLGRQGREADALTTFRQSGCSQADAHLNLAYALALSQSPHQARAQYQAALAIEPSSEAARKGLTALNAVAAKLEATVPQSVVPAGAVGGRTPAPRKGEPTAVRSFMD
jgi:Tfp pilus assembly protein PilF